jgi:hypothetical protein
MVHPKIVTNLMGHHKDSSKSCRWVGFASRVCHSQLSNDTVVLVGAHSSYSGKTHGHTILETDQILLVFFIKGMREPFVRDYQQHKS